MTQGQRVVCVNDTFSDFVRAIYTQLPVKGATGSPLTPLAVL